LAIPAPAPLEIAVALILIEDAAIVEGTVVLLSNVTVIVPPTGTADTSALAELPVTVIVYWPIDLALAGSTTTLADKLTPTVAAFAGLAVNKPMANIVAITPMTTSIASPNDVPILVFIYSYLLSSCCLKRR
jgi:hypothetical protein